MSKVQWERVPYYLAPNQRWAADYSPGGVWRRIGMGSRWPNGGFGPGNIGPGPGGGGSGTGNPGNGGGTQQPTPWQYPTMLNPPFGLGADWRATMQQYMLPQPQPQNPPPPQQPTGSRFSPIDPRYV